MYTFCIQFGKLVVTSSKRFNTYREAEDAMDEYKAICDENGFTITDSYVKDVI